MSRDQNARAVWTQPADPQAASRMQPSDKCKYWFNTFQMQWLFYFVTDGKLNIFLWIRRGLARRVVKTIMIMKEWRDDACSTWLPGRVCLLSVRQAVEINLAPLSQRRVGQTFVIVIQLLSRVFRRVFRDSVKINNSYLSIASLFR